jgi:hypothetical protein
MRTATARQGPYIGPVEVGGHENTEPGFQLSKLPWAIGGVCLAFILISAAAAYFEPGVRALHLFGCLLYLAVIVLAAKHSKWGYGIGISTAVLWLALSLFGTAFIREGFEAWAEFLKTGHITSAITFLAVPAAISQLLLIAACIWAYAQVKNKRWSDLEILLGSAVISISYLAGVVALFWPRFQFR